MDMKTIAICQCSVNYDNSLTVGNHYVVIRFEDGIFPTNPYVVVMGDNGKEVTAHKSRFDYVDGQGDVIKTKL